MAFKSAGRNKHGVIIGDDGRELADVIKCCHCQRAFDLTDGKVRTIGYLPDARRGRRLFRAEIWTYPGYCMNCGSKTCGRPECSQCVPFEKKIDELEAGKRKSLIHADPSRPGSV